MQQIVGTTDGSLWVVRQGPGVRHESCASTAEEIRELITNPCWTDSRIVDVFGPEGRYLGDVELPEGFRFSPRPALDGNRVVGVVEDEAGTIMVKRYRLMLPPGQ